MENNNMIKAVVFDLDGMVVEEKLLFSISFAKRYKIEWESVLEFFFNDYKGCLLGESDLENVIKPYLKKWGLTDVSWNDVKDLWFEENVSFQKGMLDTIVELKEKGIKCILASNNEKHKKEYFIENYNFNEIFDEIIFSCDIGSKKPNLEFLEAVLSSADCKPQEVLFCDDTPENVLAGRKFGFSSYLYFDYDMWVKKIEVLGLL